MVVVNISDHSIFSDNKAIGTSGGVIGASVYYSPGSSLAVHIADSEISHNKADNGGGVVSIETHSWSPGFSANLVFTGCVFIGNQASYGSALYMRFGGDTQYFHFIVTRSEFNNNTASIDGAVLYLVGGDEVTRNNMDIIDSKFIGNRAGNRGGVAYTSSVEHFTVTESQFTLNSAGNSGGVIASTTGEVLLISQDVASLTTV